MRGTPGPWKAMNLIHLLIIILILLVGAAALTQLNPSADKTTPSLMKGLENVRSWFDEAPGKITGTVTGESETKVYKWKDKAGEWHFSNHPPPEGVASSVKVYRSDVNITQAPKAAPKPTDQPSAATPDTAVPLLPITDPARVKQLFDDAKNVQNLVNDRKQAIDQQSNQ